VKAPDYVEPVQGWRVWLVVRDRGRLRLASVMYPTLWIPGREKTARCRRGDPSRQGPGPAWSHVSPAPRCGCGIYASKTVEHAASYFDGFGPGERQPVFRVIGRVALWGRVIEAEHGFRASHAYPSHLYVPATCLSGAPGATPFEIATGLAAYGTPIELLDGRSKRRVTDALAARPHRPGLAAA
jgi:hypothetical protein